jgi:two-component system response regulator
MTVPNTLHSPPTEIVVVEDKNEDRKSIVFALNTFVSPSHIAQFAHEHEARAFFERLNDTAAEAWENALRLIILDFHIEGHTALPILERLRAGRVTRHTPIVIFSDSNEKKSYELGANAFVTKPVDYEAFDETVQSIGYFWLDTNRV